jgi:hypothetical protein
MKWMAKSSMQKWKYEYMDVSCYYLVTDHMDIYIYIYSSVLENKTMKTISWHDLWVKVFQLFLVINYNYSN